ncbi:hypothetical protein CPB86DRAFT_785086 [Serendipita vermifera]|nr:hypothetical protein CPB86DRAFT_785086 [Serendipita vermifera]
MQSQRRGRIVLNALREVSVQVGLVSKATAYEELVRQTNSTESDFPILDISSQTPTKLRDPHSGDMQALFDLTGSHTFAAERDNREPTAAEDNPIPPVTHKPFNVHNSHLLSGENLEDITGKGNHKASIPNAKAVISQSSASHLVPYPCAKDLGDDIVLEYILGQMRTESDIANLSVAALGEQMLCAGFGDKGPIIQSHIEDSSLVFDDKLAMSCPDQTQFMPIDNLSSSQPQDTAQRIVKIEESNETAYHLTSATTEKSIVSSSGILSPASPAEGEQEPTSVHQTHSIHSDSSEFSAGSLTASSIGRGLVLRMKHILSCHAPLDSTMLA